jgi:hypothetical protein
MNTLTPNICQVLVQIFTFVRKMRLFPIKMLPEIWSSENRTKNGKQKLKMENKN